MNLIRATVSELLSLFIDDGNLAVFSIVLIAVVAGLVELIHLPALIGGALLLLGCVGILLESVMRAARKR